MGCAGCGKTTFLAALYVAVNRASQELNIFGVDDYRPTSWLRATAC